MEYSDNHDSKLVFFNPKNTNLCMQLLKLKEGLENPYTQMYYWLQEEEIDVEALIEAIASLQGLYEISDKIKNKIISLDTDLANLKLGKKTLKSIFSFRSKDEDIHSIEKEKNTAEKNIKDLEEVIRIATYNMESFIDYFKVEKLAGYYNNLKQFAELQKSNSVKINDLWQAVANDKNIQKIMKE